jgi:Acyl-CoA synthetases (AMP-forming)/AMP-acid ligases II
MADAATAGGNDKSREAAMVGRLIQTAKSAYQYPLIFKQLWHTPLVQAPDQEVVYRDLKRFTYRQIRERIGRLASALSKAGVVPGDTVGVLDWDSHRFLEAFFAIPMMGAVLQTVNVRLSPEQIAYTIDHAGASTLLVNDDFVGLLEGLKARIAEVKRLIVMSDRPRRRPAVCPSSANMRACLPRLRLTTTFPISTRIPKRPPSTRLARPDCPRGSITATGNLCCTRSVDWRCSVWRGCRDAFRVTTSTCRLRRCFTSMPGVSPRSATLAGVKQVYPGRYDAGDAGQADQE